MEISLNDYLIGFAGTDIDRVSFKSIRSIHSGTERVWLMSISDDGGDDDDNGNDDVDDIE